MEAREDEINTLQLLAERLDGFAADPTLPWGERFELRDRARLYRERIQVLTADPLAYGKELEKSLLRGFF
jgi:hypothetical protein